MGEERMVYRVLVGKLDGKSPLGRPRSRWVDNIKMYEFSIVVEGLDMVLFIWEE